MKWGSPDAPGWTIEQAMQLMALLATPFLDNGYSLALCGSVPARGNGNDLDLLAVPTEVTATPPEEMERLMCKLLGATPFEEPRTGLLRTWSRAYILGDGRQIDMQYRINPPVPQIAKEFLACLVDWLKSDDGSDFCWEMKTEQLEVCLNEMRLVPLTNRSVLATLSAVENMLGTMSRRDRPRALEYGTSALATLSSAY
jgi:hypothetical protein